MDIYQKRKIRKEKQSNTKKSSETVPINWVIPPFVNYLANPLISRN